MLQVLLVAADFVDLDAGACLTGHLAHGVGLLGRQAGEPEGMPWGRCSTLLYLHSLDAGGGQLAGQGPGAAFLTEQPQ